MGVTKLYSVRLLIFTLFAFLLGFSYSYHLPKLESFLLVEIEKQTRKHTPIRLFASQLEFHLLPLGVVLKDVKVVAQTPLDRYLAPTEIGELGARIALIPLFRGEIRLSQLFLRDSEINLFLRPELFQKKAEKADLKIDFAKIYALPIDEVRLERIQIQGRLEPQNVVFRFSNFTMSVENRFKSLFVDLNAPRVLFKPSGLVKPLNGQFEVRTLIEAEEMQISALKLKLDDSFIVASGRFNGDLAAGRLTNGALDTRTHLKFSDLNIWETVFVQERQLPVLEGVADLDLSVELIASHAKKLSATFTAQDLKVDKFFIGNLSSTLDSDFKELRSPVIEWKHPAGQALFNDFKLSREPNWKVSFRPTVKDAEIKSLLKSFGLKELPFELSVSGQGTCSGVWSDQPKAQCSVQNMQTPRFWLYSDDKQNSTTIETRDIRLTGDVNFSLTQVDFKAELQAGQKSKGRSWGKVIYEQGFDIKYQADLLDFSDVKNLIDLKIEGEAVVNGSTKGNSDYGVIDLNAEAKNAWLEDYPLGNLRSHVTYKAGQLNFESVTGQYGVSRFLGQVGIDVRKKTLALEGSLPFADLKDLQSVFQRKLTLPFLAQGTGTMKVKASGPIDIRRLSYEVRSNFYRGEIAEEGFDELVFNVNSEEGLVNSEKVFITKSSGVAEAKGQIKPTGEIDTVVIGRGFRLEQSNNVLGLGFDLQGLADFTVSIKGQLPSPNVELDGRLTNLILSDLAAEDSIFKLSFFKEKLEGSGQFLGQTIATDFSIPYDQNGAFRFNLKSTKWDFTNLFALISRSARQLDFGSEVTMNVNLESTEGGFWASSGLVQVDEFVIRKGSKSLSAPKTMTMTFKDGEIQSRNFLISSGDSYIKLDMNQFRKDHFQASLNGKLDLSLLGLFTPFISDLRGNMSVSMELGGNLTEPHLSGSAYIEKGYAKFVDFIHPFSNVRSDLIFNDNQILINSFNSEMAQGLLSGGGKVSFSKGLQPVEVNGTFSDVSINVPEGFKTRGSGTAQITGEQFPYTLKVDYTVSGGDVVYEIGQVNAGAASVKASPYLPKSFFKEIFHPFVFDISANIKNPVAINNSLMRAQVSGQIKASGTSDALLLNGQITPLPGAKVLFSDTSFDVSSAYVEYQNAPPTQPKIYLTASTRVTESTQDDNLRPTLKPYDINLLVQGRGPMPDIILSSQPPLSQREIVSLLALGVTSQTNNVRANQEAQSANTSAAVGAAILQKAGGKKIKDAFGVDVKVSSSQPTPLDTATAPMVTFSKQWTPKFGASASSTIRANPNNTVRLEYRMNKNISAVGSWEGRENLNERLDVNRNIFGLDLEYKVQFK